MLLVKFKYGQGSPKEMGYKIIKCLCHEELLFE